MGIGGGRREGGREGGMEGGREEGRESGSGNHKPVTHVPIVTTTFLT